MNKKLHILIIPSWYPEFEGDYVGSFFREQAIGLARSDCKVGVIFPQLKSLRGLKKIKIIPKFEITNDNGIVTYKFLWSNWFIKMKFLQIKAFKFLGHILFKRYIKKNGLPDIVHCHSIFNAGFLGEKLFDAHKTPYIITEHNSGFYYKDQGFEKYFYQITRIAKKSEQCLAVSENYANYLNNLFQNKIKWGVHHNIVSDIFLKTPIRKQLKENFVFICISRLSRIKNIELLIQAFNKFNKVVLKSELRIIGIGAEEKKLKKLALDLKISDKVKFLGKKLRNQVVKEINSSDVLAYASNFETFGVIFVESLALGRPVITTDCGSAKEIINKNVGLISKKNDLDGMLNSMLSIYYNYENYTSEKLREYCEENFSQKKLSMKLISVYKKLLK